jgi:hypothetical protein
MRTIGASANMIMIALLAFLGSCKGQNSDQNKFKPDVKVSVNKEFDKNNNLVRYDSSYSYHYSGSVDQRSDSIFRSLRWHGPAHFNDQFGFFKTDSLMRFFDNSYSNTWLFKNEDYFNNLFMKDLEDFERLRQKQEKQQTEKKKVY